MPEPPMPMKCAEVMFSGIGRERSGLIMAVPVYVAGLQASRMRRVWLRAGSAGEGSVDHGDDVLGAGAGADVAGRLAAGPTVALGSIRRSVAYAASHTFEEALALEGEMMTRTGATEDHRAAVEAFVAKRKPVFNAR